VAVNLKQDIKPISYVKTNAADMMKYVNEVRNPIVITQNGEARTILVDIESYQDMHDAFGLLKIVQLSERSIAQGDFKTSEEVFSEIESRLGI